MFHILISLFFISYANSIECNCESFVPIITNDFEVQLGSLCPSCEYLYSYPSGYDHIDIKYSYTDIVFTEVYQHGHVINSYNGTVCFERLFIGLEESVIIKVYTLSDNIVWGNIQHEMTFGNLNNSENRCTAPQINTILSLAQTFISSCVYEYTFPFVANIFMNIKFNDNVQVFIIYNNTIMFNETTNLIHAYFSFENKNLEYNYIELHIWPINDTLTNKFITIPLNTTSYNTYYENKYIPLVNKHDNTTYNNLSVISIVFSSFVFLMMVFFIVVIFKRKNNNIYQQL
jgi:hypothetical protein